MIKIKKWECDSCHIEIEVEDDYEPIFCCSGLPNQCGCMGKPTKPVFCDECEEEIFSSERERKDRINNV